MTNAPVVPEVCHNTPGSLPSLAGANLTCYTVCGIEQDYNQADGTSTIKKVIPIAGEYTSSHGRGLEPDLTRLKNSGSHSDSKKEGVRVELNGGRYPFDKSTGRQQKAIIEFECIPDKTGLEGDERDSREKLTDDDAGKSKLVRADAGEKVGDDEKDGKEGSGDKDGKDDDKMPEKNNASLTLVSYRLEGEGDKQVEVLRLNWQTKYACEGQRRSSPPSKSSHWGFFTWFLIV